jgi:hypothetical protein
MTRPYSPLIVHAAARGQVIVEGAGGLPGRPATLLGVDDRDRCLVEFATGRRARLPIAHITPVEATSGTSD